VVGRVWIVFETLRRVKDDAEQSKNYRDNDNTDNAQQSGIFGGELASTEVKAIRED